MAKHICAICGAEVNLLSEQKLADGNFICRKVCAKKCFKALDLVGGDLETVKAHHEQVEFGTKVWNQIFVPLKKTKVKAEKLRQVHGVSQLLVYVSPSTGLIAFNYNKYKFMFFGKTEYACVYRLADLVSYEYESESVKGSDGKDVTKHYVWLGFRNTEGMANFRLALSGKNDFDSMEKYFNELFGIEKTVRNSFKNAKRQLDAIKAAAGAVKGAVQGTLDEEQAAATVEAVEAYALGDRTEWIAKADAALAAVK